ncbi:TPA: hypothetical protein ROY23_004850 [Bacillus wiedmannii]|nr:hypothetical protein [Bacillus wiedmannii]
MIPKYKGTREFTLHRNEEGFGGKQRVWSFDVFTYKELMEHLDDGWRIHDEEKRIAAFYRKTTA